MKDISESKLKIVDAALPLFAKKGYSGTSMSDLAKAVGITKATLYSHFTSKEEIFTTILSMIIEKHIVEVSTLVARSTTSSAIESLRNIFFAYIDYCHGNTQVDFWTRFYYFPPGDLEKEIHDKTHQFEAEFGDKLQGIIESGIESHEIIDQKASDILISYYYLLIGFVMSLNFYKDKSTDKDAQSCISVFLQGIKRS